MKPSEDIRPISYLKAHAAQLVREVGESGRPIIVTQNGEARAVLQDVRSYEDLQQSLAMLKILAQSRQRVDEVGVLSVDDAFREVRAARAKRR